MCHEYTTNVLHKQLNAEERIHASDDSFSMHLCSHSIVSQVLCLATCTAQQDLLNKQDNVYTSTKGRLSIRAPGIKRPCQKASNMGQLACSAALPAAPPSFWVPAEAHVAGESTSWHCDVSHKLTLLLTQMLSRILSVSLE